MKVSYDDMTYLMKRANTTRIVCTIIGWIIFVAGAVIGYVIGKIYGTNEAERLMSFWCLGVIPGFIEGGRFIGIAHSRPFLSKIKILLYIPFPLFNLILWFFVFYMYITFNGLFVMIINIFRLIFKKPLMYSWEADYYYEKGT